MRDLHFTIDGQKLSKNGDFSNIVAAVWDNAQITIDDTSLAVYGMVRLVVNAYVDWAVIRPESFVVATIA